MRLLKLLSRLCVVVSAVLPLTGCGMVVAGPATSVAVLPGEHLIGPCNYDMFIGAPQAKQTAVLVIFERGDSNDLYTNLELRTMATSLAMPIVFAHQCNAPDSHDIQPDGATGPGRALFTALQQFATQTGYTELANANVILFGFSAAGTLSITTANTYPSRILGVIPYASGSVTLDLYNEGVNEGASHIPMLILANANDANSGTSRSYAFFKKGQALGAPWGFAVQNATDHCCSVSVKSLVIPWITAVMQNDTAVSATGQLTVKQQASPVAPTVRFLCSPNSTFDGYGQPDCNFTSESILPSTTGGPDSGWLPDAATASAWLTWVSNPKTNP